MRAPTRQSSILIAAVAVLPLSVRGAALFAVPIPKTILLTEKDVIHDLWLNDLEQRVADSLSEIGIKLVDQADMPDGFIPYLRKHRVRSYLRAELHRDDSAVAVRFELREATRALDPDAEEDRSICPPHSLIGPLEEARREVLRLLPRIKAYITEPGREHLLANCISPDVSDDELLKLGKALTVRYHEHLQKTPLGEKYSIFGISPLAFNARCRESEQADDPLDYRHVVYGYLTDEGGVDLFWQEGDDWESARLLLQGADEEVKAREIADKLIELEPKP